MTQGSASLLQSVFARNRAEELGYDVWANFVVPPFFDRLDLATARKPRIIVGGRGCGKTMLLRYLSHQSMFSPARPSIDESALSHIGLYWRADTQFANAMTKRGQPDDSWHSAFNHLGALTIGIEVLGSLTSIADSTCPAFGSEALAGLDLSALQAFDSTLPSSFGTLRNALETRLWALETWVNDVRKAPEPRFLPGRPFVLALVQRIQQQLPALGRSVFCVYLDEYENLCEYQQEIINTWLKHSEPPLIFNLAVKRNAFDTRRTVGGESLSDIHDFRQHDLEAYLSDAEDFPLFAAEILYLQLSLAGLSPLPVAPSALRDPSQLPDRRTATYRQSVLGAAEGLLPDVSHEDLASGVFRDAVVSQKLKARVQQALKHRRSQVPLSRLYRPDLAAATVVVPALLYRQTLNPLSVADELDKLAAREANRFTGPTNWIHNNFIGSLLQLYEPHFRACPFYAGFRTYCQLSHGNIRHFLELCYKSLYRAASGDHTLGTTIPPSDQAEAALQASTDLLGEVRSFGRRGNQLHTFVLRLGSLFALAHQRPTQSESEQSHFSIGTGSKALTAEDEDFLREATRWSVLYEQKGTKKKDDRLPEDLEYLLNPIYAPYFHISYRKKRRLELRSDDVICLIRGSYDDVKELLKRFTRAWSVEPLEVAPSLFSHLND